MNKKLLILVVFLGVLVVAVLGFVIYIKWEFLREKFFSILPTPIEKPSSTSSDVSSAGTLPEIQSLSNPLEKLPELNPVDKANPFKDTKFNPFE